MRQADAFDSTLHLRNLAKILDRALRSAELAFTHDASILSGCPWWHRVLGTVAAVAFYGAHFGVLK